MTPGRYLSFEAVAEDYDQTRVIPGPQLDEIARILAREAHLERGGLFLDAGVGTGRFAAPLARLRPAQVVGMDIAPAMMERIEAKTAPGSLALAQADLQRMPFGGGVFAGALLVHVLQLVEQWMLVLAEIRRVLVPNTGVLFLGVEMGGRSKLVNFYFERARARRVLASSLGSAGLAPALAYLRRAEREGGAGAKVVMLETPKLTWKRLVPIAATLDALARRTYSQTWDIPDDAHEELMAATKLYAAQTFPQPDAAETLKSRFMLSTAMWP